MDDHKHDTISLSTPYLNGEIQESEEFPREEQEFFGSFDEELIENECSCQEQEFAVDENEFKENFNDIDDQFIEEDEVLTYETLIAIDEEIEENYELIEDDEYEIVSEIEDNFITPEDYELDQEIDTDIWNQEYEGYVPEEEVFETQTNQWQEEIEEKGYEPYVGEQEWAQENHVENPDTEETGMYDDGEEIYLPEEEVDWEEREVAYNEWETLEDEEQVLEEDFFGFDFSQDLFTTKVTFPSGVLLPKVSGTESIGQEFYDPNNSGNPLLDTSRKNWKKKLSKNFEVGELAQSGKGRYKFYKSRIDIELVKCLQKLRDFLDPKSVVVIDGYYSYAHLKKIAKRRRLKKVPSSPHVSGQGAKIRVKGMSGTEIAKAIVTACGSNVSISIGTYTTAIYVKQPSIKITSYISNKAKRKAAISLIESIRSSNNKPVPSSSQDQTKTLNLNDNVVYKSDAKISKRLIYLKKLYDSIAARIQQRVINVALAKVSIDNWNTLYHHNKPKEAGIPPSTVFVDDQAPVLSFCLDDKEYFTRLTYFGIEIKYVDDIEKSVSWKCYTPLYFENVIVAFNDKAYLLEVWELNLLLDDAWKSFDMLKDVPVDYSSFSNALVTKFAEGVIGTIEDVYYGGKRTLGVLRKDKFDEVGEDNLRLYELITDNFSNVITVFFSIITGEVLIRLLRKYKNIPEDRKKSLREILIEYKMKRIGKMITRKIIRALSKKILEFMLQDALYKQLAKAAFLSKAVGKVGPGIIFTLLSFQALLEKSSMASKELKKENPLLYRILRSYDIDLLWFLVKPHMEELMFIVAITLGVKQHHK